MTLQEPNKPFCKEYNPSGFFNKNQWCNSQQTHANTPKYKQLHANDLKQSGQLRWLQLVSL